MKITAAPIIKYTKKVVNNYTSRLDYTYQHKKAFLKLEKEFLGKNTLSGYLHDTNKLFMYAIGLPKNWVRKIHRAISPHHEHNGKIKNLRGAIIDWECARYTKADKQITARQYYERFVPNIKGADEMLKRFGL